MACLVTALKATRSIAMPFFSDLLLAPSTSRMCQEMASPSRSGSVARISLSAPFHGVGDLVHHLAATAVVHVPVHLEVLVGLDRAVLGRQIADMAVRCDHLVVLAQVLVDGLGLGGRLDDQDVHAVLSMKCGAAETRAWDNL